MDTHFGVRYAVVRWKRCHVDTHFCVRNAVVSVFGRRLGWSSRGDSIKWMISSRQVLVVRASGLFHYEHSIPGCASPARLPTCTSLVQVILTPADLDTRILYGTSPTLWKAQ